MAEIGLGEAIRALRAELSEAKGQGDGAWLRFQVGPVSLELQLVVSKDVHGQVGWNILEVGGAGGSQRTQKVSLTLTPQWWDGTKYTTDALVSGLLPAVPEPSGTPDWRADGDGAGSAADEVTEGGPAESGLEGVPLTDAEPDDED